MTSLTWPAVTLLSVLAMCVSTLVWKGAISSHVLTTMLGAVVGYLFQRSGLVAMMSRTRSQSSPEFSPDEIVTANESMRPPPLPSESKKDK